MTTELTPAVQDAAHNLGWAMARAGKFVPSLWSSGALSAQIDTAFREGHRAFTPEAEAERVEAVREAGK